LHPNSSVMRVLIIIHSLKLVAGIVINIVYE